MNAVTLVDLAAHFDTKLTNLHSACDLSGIKHDPSCQKVLGSVHKELEGLECILTLMRSEIQKIKEAGPQIQELKTTYNEIIEDIKYAINHVPARLPNKQSASQQSVETPKPDKTKKSTDVPKTTHTQKVVKEVMYCPAIEYLIVDEFDSVPKYMKGRLTYNQVNSVIDELNKAYKNKYKIMKMKKSKMNDVNRKRYDNYKLQETKDTPGLYFVVEADIKEFSSMKMDASSRSMITVLRHCGRLREIRGGGITRYAIIESY